MFRSREHFSGERNSLTSLSINRCPFFYTLLSSGHFYLLPSPFSLPLATMLHLYTLIKPRLDMNLKPFCRWLPPPSWGEEQRERHTISHLLMRTMYHCGGSWPNHLPRALPPSARHWGLGIQHMNLVVGVRVGGCNMRSIKCMYNANNVGVALPRTLKSI